MQRSETGVTLSSGTAYMILVGVLGGGLWLGVLQAQVIGLQKDVSDTRTAHAQIMAKLNEIDGRIVAVQLQLGEERTQQRMLHRGQLPVER